MMVRLLKLKTAISDYFRRHASNNRKLSNREWTITNEVCSLLDVVAEVTIKIQGSSDTHISQTMFNMLEIKEIFQEDEHKIRTPDQLYDGGSVLKERQTVDELSSEAQTVRNVMLERLEKKELGQARMPLERICALLDPRRKDCSADHLVNGSAELKKLAIDDVKSVAERFVEPVLSVSSAAGGGGGGSGGDDGSTPPAPKKQMVASDLEERRRARLAKVKSRASSGAGAAAQQGPAAATRRMLIARELRMYVAEDSEPEEDGFSLLAFWSRRRKASTNAETNEVEPGLPYLALIARLYHAIESTSCQAERNFSLLSFLIGNLRSSMLPLKVERMMFLRLNRLFIPEVKNLNDAIDANKAATARCQEKVMAVEIASANTPVVLTV